jgi:hypothetical protein
MNSRIGKIARLPKQIREQINLRLENGERGPTILKWLNGLPEVQKIITEQFAGRPIRPQNLSQWRNGGYVDWLRLQQLREQTRWTTEQSSDLHSDTDANTISIAENVALIMSAELALHVQALLAINKPKERFRQFRLLSRELSRMRRDDQRALRTQMRRQQSGPTLAPEPDPDLEIQNEQSETPEPQPTTQPPTLTASEPSEPPLDTRPSTLPEPFLDPQPSPLSESPLDPPPSPLAPCDVPTAPYPSTINHQPSTTPPPLPAIPQNPTKSQYKNYPVRTHRRGFTCIEG